MEPCNRPLVIGLSIAFAGVVLFALIAPFANKQTSAMAQFDSEVAQAMREYSKDEYYFGMTMVAFTVIGGVPFMTGVAILGGAFQFIRRQWLLGIAWLLIPLFGALLNVGLKAIFERQRPPADWRDPFVDETNESFPSGHAMGAAIGWTVAGYMFCLLTRRRGVRWLIGLGMALLIVGIGLSRVYLRAHWLSDVVAGWSIGLAWAAGCLAFVEKGRGADG